MCRAKSGRKGECRNEGCKGEAVLGPVPEGKEYGWQVKDVAHAIDEGVAEYGEAQGDDDGKDEKNHEEHGFEFQDEPVLFIPVFVKSLVARLDHDLDALGRGP